MRQETLEEEVARRAAGAAMADFMDPDVEWYVANTFIEAFQDFQEEVVLTTKVTIDAHAGWPVLVVTKVGEPSQAKSYVTTRVEAYAKLDVYIHSGCSIVDIVECTENHVPRGQYEADKEASGA